MRLVPVEQVAANIRAIDDPVLRGKVQKALHMLHRTLELYRCGFRSDLGALSCCGAKRCRLVSATAATAAAGILAYHARVVSLHALCPGTRTYH
jgi:hypothetical protein